MHTELALGINSLASVIGQAALGAIILGCTVVLLMLVWRAVE